MDKGETMICKFCNSLIPDGAMFCPSCGKRLDGKTPCPECGAMNEENAMFCIFCGARMDGKKVCGACGALYEGHFCPECGASASQETPSAVNVANSATPPRSRACI